MSEDFAQLQPLVFLSTAVGLILLEQVRALRRQPVGFARRWTSNLALLLIGSAVAGVLLPVGIYAFAQQQMAGVLSGPALPFALQVLLTFLLLDCWKYWEHRAFHKVSAAVAPAPRPSQRYGRSMSRPPSGTIRWRSSSAPAC